MASQLCCSDPNSHLPPILPSICSQGAEATGTSEAEERGQRSAKLSLSIYRKIVWLSCNESSGYAPRHALQCLSRLVHVHMLVALTSLSCLCYVTLTVTYDPLAAIVATQ